MTKKAKKTKLERLQARKEFLEKRLETRQRMIKKTEEKLLNTIAEITKVKAVKPETPN